MMKFPVVDAHLHLWNTKKLDYPWLKENELLNRSYLLDEYKKACGNINVQNMVFIQCECSTKQYKDEAKWITELAKSDNRIQAIIPFAPLEMGDGVRKDLDEFSENKLIKGIRRIIEFEDDINFCLQPEFVKGVKILSEYNYSFDINISYRQMENTIKFVKQCPNVMFILDHEGKPGVKYHQLDPWGKQIKELSKMPNVYCKISGLVTEADYQRWAMDDIRPYVDKVIECFGFDRILFGGDWPVVTQAAAYTKWFNVLMEIVKNCTENELYKLFYQNAVNFYKLK